MVKTLTSTFTDLGISQEFTSALAEKGILSPFPIQKEAIPVALTGQDIIGQAKTGTGKTLAFGLPLLQRIVSRTEPGVKALIVVPTRELALQVAEDLVVAAANTPLRVVTIYGGKGYDDQIAQLEAGAEVAVGTPGRIIDLMGRRVLNLSSVSEVVLDEADKMLDLGFISDIERIFASLPAVRHTLLFSATMPAEILTLARRFLSRPLHIRVSDPDEGTMQANIKHIVYRAHAMDKVEMVARILQAEGREKVVVFTKTKREAAKVSEELKDRGFNVASVHGDMNQEARERSMQTFRTGKNDVLIATEVAARGIDVDDVSHVINYSIPEDEKSYLHRVGRTGRAGRTGIAVTLVEWDELHRWGLINKALDFGNPDPAETYSSSPNLYEDLNIPEGTKGRLRTSAAPQGGGSGSSASQRGRQQGGREGSSRSRSGQSQRSESADSNKTSGDKAKAEGTATARPRVRKRVRRPSQS